MAIGEHEFVPSVSFCAGYSKIKHPYCAHCGHCQEPTCDCCLYDEFHIVLPVNSHYRTQKARCVVTLNMFMPYESLNVQVLSELENTPYNNKTFHKMLDKYGVLFARPCPVAPRHGFVDSRKVKNYDELLSVLAETKKSDSQGEVLLMPFIKASYNIVHANGVVTIGQGNDGATSGMDTIKIPTANELPFFPLNPEKHESMLRAATITDAPYIEAVCDSLSTKLYYTQLRNGPKVDCKGNDFIPKKITVKKVIVPDTKDLERWELDCLEYAKIEGLIVCHVGGAISSHFGVHCIINNIPYITSFEPKIGDVLTPTQSQRRLEPDYNAFFEGFKKGENLPILGNEYTRNMQFILSSLHNIPFATSEETQYLGAAIALLLRFGIAACWGEVRHYYGVKRVTIEGSRDMVYKKAFKDFKSHLEKMPLIEYVFIKGDWSSSYGGKKWANCTEQTIKLWNNVCRLYRKKTAANYKRLLNQFNSVINCIHNGGWWLNKYTSKEVFDMASISPSWAIIHSAPIYYQLAKAEKVSYSNEFFSPLLRKKNFDSDYAITKEDTSSDNERRSDD